MTSKRALHRVGARMTDLSFRANSVTSAEPAASAHQPRDSPPVARGLLRRSAGHLGPCAVDYFLGLLATRAGRPAEALERSSARCSSAPRSARSRSARRVLVALARAHAASGAAEPAQRRLGDALELAQRLDMQPLAAEIGALRADLRGAAAAVAGEPAPEAHPVLRCEGDYWTVAHGGEVSRVRDAVGLHYLRTLLREPGREFHVLDLAGGAEAGRCARRAAGPVRGGAGARRRRGREARAGCPARSAASRPPTAAS